MCTGCARCKEPDRWVHVAQQVSALCIYLSRVIIPTPWSAILYDLDIRTKVLGTWLLGYVPSSSSGTYAYHCGVLCQSLQVTRTPPIVFVLISHFARIVAHFGSRSCEDVKDMQISLLFRALSAL